MNTVLRSFAMIAPLVAFPLFAQAQGKPEHAHGKEAGHYKVPPPADVKAAWSLIVSKVQESETKLAGMQMDAVHEIGEQLEAAAHVLQTKSDMVTDAARKRLDSALAQLDKAIDGLHHAAEEKEAAQATLELGKIKGLLPLIENQYPAGVLR
jgi:hypothetical protein